MFIKQLTSFSLIFIIILAAAASATATQEEAVASTGGVKGKVRVETGEPQGVTVTVLRGEEAIARALTDRKGEFEIRDLQPGSYALSFRKAGLKVGKLDGVEVRAGKVRSLGDRLQMSIDEGSLAIVQGRVFDEAGFSLQGVKVEVARVLRDGALQKIDTRTSSSETGRFVFKLSPEAARYRVTATASKRQAASAELTVDGAAVYRVALTLAKEKK